MKNYIARYISRLLECQQVKVEHKNPPRLLQPMQILELKWEIIFMDLITGFPRTNRKHNVIMGVVDKMSKESHFIPIKSTYKAIDVDDSFIKDIFRLHGIPKTII